MIDDTPCLASDHALLLSALWSEKAELTETGVFVWYPLSGGQRCEAFKVNDVDAYGCPSLTPQLREALQKAKGKT